MNLLQLDTHIPVAVHICVAWKFNPFNEIVETYLRVVHLVNSFAYTYSHTRNYDLLHHFSANLIIQ